MVTAVFIFFGSRLYIDNSVSTGFPKYNKDFQELQKFLDDFKGDELIVVAYKSGEVLTKKHLKAIDWISGQIEDLDKILGVTSLTTVSEFAPSESSPGSLEPVSLIRRDENGEIFVPEDEEELAKLRKRILSNDVYVNSIISEGGDATAIVAYVENDPDDDSYKSRLVKQIQAIVGSSGLKERFYYAGPPVFTSELDRCIGHDLSIFTPIVVVMIGLVLFYVFRGWRSVVLPLLTVMMCVLWTAGFMQITTGRLTIASTILPPLMIAIGVAIVIHVFTQYQDELRLNIDRRPALEETITHIAWPCLLTAITTALGFMSLSASEIPTIIETGLFAAFGVMTAYLIAMAFVPSVLMHTKAERRSVEQLHPFLVRGLRGIGRLNESRPRIIILVTILLAAIAVWGITTLEVETNLINYFPADTEVRKSQDFVSKHLGGSITMDVVIERADGGSVAEAKLIEKINDLEAHMKGGYRAVGKVLSVASVVEEMNDVMREYLEMESLGKELRAYYSQRHLDTVVQMRTETTLFDSLVNEDFTKLRVTARLHQASSREILDSVARMEKYLAENFNGEYRATLTGSTRLFAKMGRILVEGEIKGLGMALISIFIVITILFRNVWMGLIAMVPNVVPIGITLAVMGFTGIPINVTTAMIPCIALGIAVDDTIHYVSRFKREFHDDRHYVNSMFRTLLSTGKPIIFTSAVLFCGFITLAFSDFSCNAYFGILTSITMAAALLGDLIILPVLINVLRPLRWKPETEE